MLTQSVAAQREEKLLSDLDSFEDQKKFMDQITKLLGFSFSLQDKARRTKKAQLIQLRQYAYLYLTKQERSCFSLFFLQMIIFSLPQNLYPDPGVISFLESLIHLFPTIWFGSGLLMEDEWESTSSFLATLSQKDSNVIITIS